MDYGLKSSDLPKKSNLKNLYKTSSILGVSRDNFYGLWHLSLKQKTNSDTLSISSNDAVIFAINGSITIYEYSSPFHFKKINLTNKKSYLLKKNNIFQIHALKKSDIMIFHKNISKIEFNILPFSLINKKAKFKNIKNTDDIFDLRDKYWGSIYSVFSDDTCGKVMNIHAKSTGSLEYHLEKYETYYILEGSCFVDIRYGRAINKTIKLNKGNIYHLSPGIMHRRRGSSEKCVIVEISTKDQDSDSYIVESGV
tara:strand:+ start:1233 stop:1991 length:759 start_codon:yes stop_codon:yes gene_type:complete